MYRQRIRNFLIGSLCGIVSCFSDTNCNNVPQRTQESTTSINNNDESIDDLINDAIADILGNMPPSIPITPQISPSNPSIIRPGIQEIPDYLFPTEPISEEQCRTILQVYEQWNNSLNKELTLESIYDEFNESGIEALANIAAIYVAQKSGLTDITSAIQWVNTIFEEVYGCSTVYLTSNTLDYYADEVLEVYPPGANFNASNALGEPGGRYAVIEEDGYIVFGFADFGATRGNGNDIVFYFAPSNATAFVDTTSYIFFRDGRIQIAGGGEQVFTLDPVHFRKAFIDVNVLFPFENQVDELVFSVAVGSLEGQVKLDAIEVLNPRRIPEDLNSPFQPPIPDNPETSSGDPFVDGYGVTNILMQSQENALGAPDGIYAIVQDPAHGNLSFTFIDNIPYNGPGDDLFFYIGPVEVDNFFNLNITVLSNVGATEKSFYLQQSYERIIGLDVPWLGNSNINYLDIILTSNNCCIYLDAIESRYNK